MIQLCSKMSTQNRYIRSSNLLVQIVPMYDSNFFLFSPWILYSSFKPNNWRQALNLSFPLSFPVVPFLLPIFTYLNFITTVCLLTISAYCFFFQFFFFVTESLSSEVSNNLLAHIHYSQNHLLKQVKHSWITVLQLTK